MILNKGLFLTCFIKGLGPYESALASLTPGPISSNDNCGDSARGYFEEYVANGKRTVVISGAPNHVSECGAYLANPNTRCK